MEIEAPKQVPIKIARAEESPFVNLHVQEMYFNKQNREIYIPGYGVYMKFEQIKEF